MNQKALQNVISLARVSLAGKQIGPTADAVMADLWNDIGIMQKELEALMPKPVEPAKDTDHG